MKIGLVSTWNVECGIATYTQKLAQVLLDKGHEVTIYEEQNKSNLGDNRSKSGRNVRLGPRWSRFSPFAHPYGLGSIFSDPYENDLVHIQHEFGLFPRTEDLARLSNALGKKLFVTAHTVDPNRVGFERMCKELANPLIVHTLEAKAVSPFETKVIPHGCSRVDRSSFENVLLVPGFVSRSKNTLEIVKAFITAKNRGLSSRLRILGLCRDGIYASEIRELINKYDIGDEVDLEIAQFVSDERVREELSKCKAVILGGRDSSPYSASGQLHDAVGAALPVFAKNLPIYRSCAYAGVLYYEDSESLSRLMTFDSDTAEVLSKTNSKVRGLYTWDKVADKTLEYYATRLRIPPQPIL